jgi:hypothetical protein
MNVERPPWIGWEAPGEHRGPPGRRLQQTLDHPLGRTRQDQDGLKTTPCQVFRFARIVGGFGAHGHDRSAVVPEPQLKLIEERFQVLGSQLRRAQRGDCELDIRCIEPRPGLYCRLERLDQIAQWLPCWRRWLRCRFDLLEVG